MLFSSPLFWPWSRSLTIMKGVRTRRVLPYINHIGMHCPKGRVLGLFGLKTLCPFWSEIRYGFRGNYGRVHERTYSSLQFQMNKNEIEICEFEMYLENIFLVMVT